MRPISLEPSGLAGFDVQAGFGLFAPAGTPNEIVERLYEAAQFAIKDPETRKKLEDLSADVIGNRPDEFATIVRDEVHRCAGVVKPTPAGDPASAPASDSASDVALRQGPKKQTTSFGLGT